MPRRTNRLRTDELAEACGSWVVHVDQLVHLGVSRSTIGLRCGAGGPWQRVAPAVVKLSTGPLTRDDRRRGVLLTLGQNAVLTGLDALELYGMEQMPRPSGPIHVLVPGTSQRTGRGIGLVERTARLPTPAPGRWPLAPIERAALDAARRLTLRAEVRATLAEVVQRGRGSPGALAAELAAGSQRGSALPREVLAEIGEGARSAAEAQAHALVTRSALPPPLWNPRLADAAGRALPTPDAWFDDVGLAWEIDSVQWHLRPSDYAETLRRHNVLTAAGAVVLHTPPSRLRTHPAEVLRELEATHRGARARPRPRITAKPCE